MPSQYLPLQSLQQFWEPSAPFGRLMSWWGHPLLLPLRQSAQSIPTATCIEQSRLVHFQRGQLVTLSTGATDPRSSTRLCTILHAQPNRDTTQYVTNSSLNGLSLKIAGPLDPFKRSARRALMLLLTVFISIPFAPCHGRPQSMHEAKPDMYGVWCMSRC